MENRKRISNTWIIKVLKGEKQNNGTEVIFRDFSNITETNYILIFSNFTETKENLHPCIERAH